jgi:hypothetical protein
MIMIRKSVHRGQACLAKSLVVSLGVVALALVVLAAPCLHAGSVFMKNGYIIQGPIVDVDEEVVVLGWSNGKAYIHKRFYESVNLAPEEEAEIERRRLEASELDSNSTPEDEIVITGNVDDELPADFQELVSIVVPDLMDGDTGTDSGFLVDPQDLIDGSFDPVSDPAMVDTVEHLAPRQYVSEIGVSLSPPTGWVREDGAGNVRWTGDAQSDQFLPSLVIVAAAVTTEWSLEDALESLRKDPVAVLEDFDVVEANELTIGGREAHKIIGRGVAERSEDSGESSLQVTQILVPSEHQYWIITTFTSEATDTETQAAIRQAAESVEFIDRQ